MLINSSIFHLKVHKLDQFVADNTSYPLVQGRFVTCNWTWSPGHGDKFRCTAWNSFDFQVFPVIFHTANLRDLVFIRTCFFPRGFSNRFRRAGKSNGRCMDILNRRVYQGCVCHVGVTSIIASIFSRRTLFITRPIRLMVGNAKPKILFQSCCTASVAKLFRSGFHAIYGRSWWHFLEANRFTAWVPKSLVIFRKTFWWSFQSDESVAFLDSQSALTFNLLGRYSAVIVIWRDSR